jgi:hypothetical protein
VPGKKRAMLIEGGMILTSSRRTTSGGGEDPLEFAFPLIGEHHDEDVKYNGYRWIRGILGKSTARGSFASVPRVRRRPHMQ